ncbi:MAG TPA: ATP-grasp domain-containing protein [Chthoniobacteraceae bacterium]|jgi:hypothetical protein
MQHEPDDIDVFHLEKALWIAELKVGLPSYDFPFTHIMACSYSRFGLDEVTAVGRFGAVDDYHAIFTGLLDLGVRLVHSPEQHDRCSELPLWYPILEGLTPESWWFDRAPDAEVAGRLAGWPLFMKGSQKTKGHRAKHSIIANEEAYRSAVEFFAADERLSAQKLVIRRLEQLQPVEAEMGEKIPASYEFRTFWWRGELVGAGPYFAAFAHYQWTERECAEALALAEEAARRLELPFVGIDVAKCRDGRWIIIEINDAQECGYTGIKPLPMWQKIVDIERSNQFGTSQRG